MKDRFIEDEIKSTIKKLLIMEIIDNGIQPMPRNMITKTKLFESNLQMGREIYFMKVRSKMATNLCFGQI